MWKLTLFIVRNLKQQQEIKVFIKRFFVIPRPQMNKYFNTRAAW